MLRQGRRAVQGRVGHRAKASASGSETYALQWALFPQHDSRLAIAPDDRRLAIRERLKAVAQSALPAGGASERQRTLALGRGRLAELEGKYDDAVKDYSDALPSSLADVRDEHAEALLARAEVRLATVVRRMPENLNWNSQAVPFDAAGATPQQIAALRRAAVEADAAGRAAGLPKDRIRAAELKLIAATRCCTSPRRMRRSGAACTPKASTTSRT